MEHANAEPLQPPGCERGSLSQSADDWQRAMREAITDVDTLFARLALPARYLDNARRGVQTFGLRVPASYLARMRLGDIDDPLLRQVLPLAAEQDMVDGFDIDAVGDSASALGDGVLHKYHGRALLVTTGACAVHCRYCFRRHFDYSAQHAGAHQGRDALAHIAADSSIREVILSGGDPLSLSNARLQIIGHGLDAIDHVDRLRLHTRTAVVLPERIDAGFVDWIATRRQRCVIVIHANHANEIDADVTARLRTLTEAGAVLLNQSVLLHGVNDSVDALCALSERLFAAGVMPYYLHLLDRVAGIAHFEVEESRARSLTRDMAARLPGYLVPRLAREQAGERSKRVFGHSTEPAD